MMYGWKGQRNKRTTSVTMSDINLFIITDEIIKKTPTRDTIFNSTEFSKTEVQPTNTWQKKNRDLLQSTKRNTGLKTSKYNPVKNNKNRRVEPLTTES